MEAVPPRTPVALFVALMRAVREAQLADPVRDRTYDLVDRLAREVGRPAFGAELAVLVACAEQEPRLRGALQPFWAELRALSASPQGRRGLDKE